MIIIITLSYSWDLKSVMSIPQSSGLQLWRLAGLAGRNKENPES